MELNEIKLSSLIVKKISAADGKEFIKEHHYSHGSHNWPMCYGLFLKTELVGVCAFATPCSERVCSSVFGEEHKRSVTELHRLVLLDKMPRNTESWFIARALRELKKDKPYYNAVLSFADRTESHVGYVYQATNAIYTGTSSKQTFYEDELGRLRHPRQNGVNISLMDAKLRGWKRVRRDSKYRYLFLLPDNKRHKKELLKLLKLESLQYPKL